MSEAEAEKAGLVDRATQVGREALDEIGNVFEEIVAEAPNLWEKTRRAAESVAAEVQEKGPGLWEQAKALAADAADRFDEAFSGQGENEKPAPEDPDEASPDEASSPPARP
jgi:enoyl-CoA hydratase/carnithine racemase